VIARASGGPGSASPGRKGLIRSDTRARPVTRRTTLAKLSTEGHPRPSRAVSSPDPNRAHLALAGSLEKNRTYVPSGRFYPA
jgi:hypothetical protein